MSGWKKLFSNLSNSYANSARLTFGLAVVVSVWLFGCGSATKPTVLPTELQPAKIERVNPAEQAETVLRLRFYVGADHRARVIGWEEELTTVVELASSLLQRASGVRLELVESVGWERAGGPLGKTLSSLAANDPGLDVDVVVGLVDASEDSLDSFETLVMVNGEARHIVVRGFHWQAESAALGSAGESLGESAKDRLLIARRKHKQSVALAHGIAALFGESAAFGPEYAMSTTSMQAEAGARLGQAISKTLAVRAEAKLRKPAKPEPGALRLIDRENLAQVLLLLEANKPGVAWEILEPLLELYPDHAEIASAGCLVADAREASDVGARCARAVALGSADPASLLALAKTQIENHPDKALQTLKRVEAVLDAGAAEWRTLAVSYKELQLATHASRAAAKAKDAASVATWARESQARYAVAVGVAPDDEGRYLRALKAALVLVYDKKISAAAAAASELSKSFPKSVATSFIQCEVSMHKRKYAEAALACQAVVAAHPENSWARYLQGIALARENRNDDAMRLLAEAIDRDVTLEPAYKALGQLYRKSGNARLGALRGAYKKTFGKSL